MHSWRATVRAAAPAGGASIGRGSSGYEGGGLPAPRARERVRHLRDRELVTQRSNISSSSGPCSPAVERRVHDGVAVLHRHRPAGEGHHLAAVLHVEVVQDGLLQVRVGIGREAPRGSEGRSAERSRPHPRPEDRGAGEVDPSPGGRQARQDANGVARHLPGSKCRSADRERRDGGPSGAMRRPERLIGRVAMWGGAGAPRVLEPAANVLGWQLQHRARRQRMRQTRQDSCTMRQACIGWPVCRAPSSAEMAH